jgi:hypothetical protein
MALVRVKDPVSGAEFTTSEEWAESAGLTVLKDKDAVDHTGRTVETKYNTTKSGETAKKAGS